MREDDVPEPPSDAPAPRLEPGDFSGGAAVRALVRAVRGGLPAVAGHLVNGLERALNGLWPGLGEAKAALVEAGCLGAVLSGSGPTVIGVAPSRAAVHRVMARLRGRPWRLWATQTVAGPALTVAVTASAVFIASQARVAHPMVPLDLFRSRGVANLLVIGFVYMIGYYGMPFVVSLYVQQVRGLSALAAGALFVPMMLAGAALTPFWTRAADRVGRKALIAGGLTSMTVGLVALGVLPSSAPVWLLSVLMILVGVGGPLVMPPATAILLDIVPEHRAGTASAVFNTSRQVGGALAVALFGALLATPATFMRGVHVSLLIAAALLAVTIPAGLLLRTNTHAEKL